MTSPFSRALMLILMVALTCSRDVAAQDEYENAPISYSASQPDNCISRLQEQLNQKKVSLQYEDGQGYLKSLLAALNVPVESQVMVFSKTSLQIRRITPKTPRAIYFNDDVYIGYCHSGDVLEISATDPVLGTVFYTLNQDETQSPPTFDRRVDNCLVCHSSSRTENVPGHLVRSLYVDDRGYPVLSAGSRSVNHTTPFDQRWGGWYVTGQHGSQKHLGNLTVDDDAIPERVDNAAGQNRSSLSEFFNTERYLTPHSDIVALMVLEHQVLVHNRITNANFTTRQALEYDATMGKVLDQPPGKWLESTTRRIHGAGNKLVDALLMVDEAPLSEPISGTSGYAEQFSQTGPRDSKGRSLRDLDLSHRLLKYPCSYLIYSEAFASLPPEVKSYVWQRLWDVLSGTLDVPEYAHLTEADRTAIVEILRETIPDLPEYWKK